MLNIRKAELSDLPVICSIEQAAHVSPWSEGIFKGSFSQRNYNFIAEQEGKVLGYLFTSFIAGELTLENICVAEQAQRKGVGQALMAQLFQLADKLTALDIWLEVRASNVAAIELYKKFGFTEQGVRKNYYSIPNSSAKEDAILMKKAC